MINSLPNDKILVLTKLKAFADDILSVDKRTISVFNGLENIVGKAENAGYQHFLLFPQYFQKASYTRSLKIVTVYGVERQVKFALGYFFIDRD